MQEMMGHYLKGGQVSGELLDYWFQGTRLALRITHQSQVKEQSIAAVLFILNAYRAPN